MSVLLDHIFICSAVGAPEADRLAQFGLTEGSPNQHPGQGTACRRFFFHNAMLELLWVHEVAEARSEQTRPTRLWERWSAAGRDASPFGIIVRPTSCPPQGCPFTAWEYRPKAMPELVLQIAAGTEILEPMWCYMEGGRAPAEAPPERLQPLDHPAGLREITGVRIVCPSLAESSVTGAMVRMGVISLEAGLEHFIQLQFDNGGQNRAVDFRPDLPLIFRW